MMHVIIYTKKYKMLRTRMLFSNNNKLTSLSMFKLDVDYSLCNIYFRGGVTLKNGMQLTRIVENMNEEYKGKSNCFIKLHITSDGGDANVGLFCYDKLRLSKIPIYTYCEGTVVSAATMIFMAGQQRFMTEHSKLLIHQLSSENSDLQTYEQMKDNIYNAKMLMRDYKKIYLQETRIKESVLNKLLKKDIFLDAGQCVEYGFVNKILK